ncbi:MAG: M50 family metallopeptidase [Firmicutes bacterium]|nr:M50 family metallopeptidase [Bacillota bacterium]
MSIIFAILIFSFLIFIHELGHFLAAKGFGVQVNEFSLFMGPAIFKKQVGETVYSIRCIPFGGFCAMEGEDEDTDNPRSFQKAAWWKRLIILVAGAAMNLVAGVLIMMIFFVPVKELVMPVISSFTDYSTVCGEDGLQVGDRILEVDGEKIYVQADFSLMLTLNPGEVHDLVVERNGQKVILDDFRMERHEVIDEEGNSRMLYGMNFTLVESPSLGTRLRYGLLNAVDSVRNVRLSLQMVFTGKVGIQDVGGPVMIVDQMSQVAQASKSWTAALMNMLLYGGIIAINLAVMNMLPIPALDGGRVFSLVVVTVIEAITKKKVNPKYEGYIHAAGMILLLILMALIMFKDIFTIVRR